MRQVVIRDATTFEVERVPVPVLRSPEELLLRTAVCGICSGDLMEWYLARKKGTVLGHEVVGYVETVGPEVAGIRPGQLVFVHHHAPCGRCRFCRTGDFVHCPTWRASKLDPGGMADYVRVPADNARADTFVIEGLSPESGMFIEPLGCAVKALLRARADRSDVGAVVGCGVMGLLNLAVARALGTRELWAIEPDPFRRDLAGQFGAEQRFHPDEIGEKVRRPRFEGADYVVVGPGRSEVIEEAARYLRPGGILLLFTPTPSGCRTPLDLGDWYFRELSLVPSYSCGPPDTRLAYQLLREGKIDVSRLVTHRFPPEQIDDAYQTAKRGGAALKVLVEFHPRSTGTSDV